MEGVSGVGTNMGFMCKNNVMLTYKQTKKGLSYFYPKRKMYHDGVSTDPLNV